MPAHPHLDVFEIENLRLNDKKKPVHFLVYACFINQYI